MDDGALLRDYVQSNSEHAFAELVRRHLDLVYSTALRSVNGDNALAEDVCQTVFIDLARKAASVANRPALSGWLYTSTYFAAAKAIRSERRRVAREQKSLCMQEAIANSGSTEEADWESVRPVFDSAMLELKDSDRQLLLLRFFERRSLPELARGLGLTENAVRMRVERALQRLRERLLRRGVSSGAAALALVLTQHTVAAAPSGLAASITSCVLSTSGIAGASTALNLIAMTKIKTAVLWTLVVAGVATPMLIQYRTNVGLRTELEAQRSRLAAAPVQSADAGAAESGEIERLRRENAELVRLRREIAALRQRVSAVPEVTPDADVQKRMKKLANEAVEAKVLLAKSPEIPMISSRQWSNQGFTSAVAAFETLNWAVANRDTNAFGNSLMWDAQAKQRADALFAAAPDSVRQKYGTVDGVILDWFLNNSTPIAANRVLSQVAEGPNEVSLVEQHLYTDGRVRENTVQFARDENGGWRQVVPPELMPKLEGVLANLSGTSVAGGK